MALFPLHIRTIVEEDSYKAGLKTLRISYERMDVALESMGNTLIRHPEIFPKPSWGMSRIRIVGCLGVPQANIWFTYDKDEVHLWEIELAED